MVGAVELTLLKRLKTYIYQNALQSNKPSRWWMTYCKLGGAWFWLGVRFETGNSKAVNKYQIISHDN